MYNRVTFKTLKAIFPVAILLSLLMLFNLCSCQALAGADNLELRIMSFNIRYGTANDGENHWKNRKEMVFDVLRDHNPDIVGLQEALDFQIAEICSAVGKYGRIGVAREDGKTDGKFTGRFVR